MKRIPLSEYAKTHGQGKTAKVLNVTQAAICKAVQMGRDIHIIIDKKGSVIRAEEVRSFPHQVK
ncbi:Cro/Cl family transcriptional regulator [Muribacter muris]|uniref:Cro/Cl family transcriptional regulator n=1 Tax=Muribacter muris TaxID=67855 RepID=A0A4Y9K4K2_9PAST|nr:Cro/CI family transcriptional regulator [Muribacter muris]MBF0784466.1 Cro/Cl family transcriptional regulator [Muribacter muris]MBF0826238.1 Cro/Cl family transcriptional regulator [Muribacter muris]TFV11980.1 Cro/Cl family transcriptional regulator [Muribacter muris]